MQTDYLIVGVGNTLRSDDGAGWILAQQLGSILTAGGAKTAVRLVQQLLPELAAEISDLAPTVLVIADCTAQAEQPPLQRLAPAAGALEWEALDSHGLTPVQLLIITERLYEFSGSAWLATVPASSFAHGEGLSETAQRAITTTAPCMAAQLLAAVRPAATTIK